jgi:single-strand DNA-binding protein
MAQLIGVFRIGKDAEIREAKGKSVINLALAYNYGMKDNGGDRPTQWVDAALWGVRAEKLEQYLVKGQQIFCTINDVNVQTFEKRDGGSGVKLVGMVSEIELVGGKPAGGREERPARREPERRAPAPKPAPGGFDDMDDDIPF